MAMLAMSRGSYWHRYHNLRNNGFFDVITFNVTTKYQSSLRVNLDVGKLVYAWMIQRDDTIPETIVRNTTIAEEMGRITYLLSDKTGTLTRNEMVGWVLG